MDPSGNVDYSAAFAADNNWSLDGGFYIDNNRAGHLNWLSLAGGGLRLNSPDEVRAKIIKPTSR